MGTRMPSLGPRINPFNRMRAHSEAPLDRKMWSGEEGWPVERVMKSATSCRMNWLPLESEYAPRP